MNLPDCHGLNSMFCWLFPLTLFGWQNWSGFLSPRCIYSVIGIWDDNRIYYHGKQYYGACIFNFYLMVYVHYSNPLSLQSCVYYCSKFSNLTRVVNGLEEENTSLVDAKIHWQMTIDLVTWGSAQQDGSDVGICGFGRVVVWAGFMEDIKHYIVDLAVYWSWVGQ